MTTKVWHGIMEQIGYKNFCYPGQSFHCIVVQLGYNKFCYSRHTRSFSRYYETYQAQTLFLLTTKFDIVLWNKSGTKTFATILMVQIVYNTFISDSIMKQIGYKNFFYPQQTKYGIVLQRKFGKCIIF